MSFILVGKSEIYANTVGSIMEYPLMYDRKMFEYEKIQDRNKMLIYLCGLPVAGLTFFVCSCLAS